MKSDCRYLFPESWNLRKVTSVGSDFLSPASLDINSPFFKYILPMTPKMHKKKINFFFQVFDVKTGCQKLRFFWFFFNCKKWQVLIKNIEGKEKIKYYLYYYLTHWWKKKFRKINFFVGYGVLIFFFLTNHPFWPIFLPFIDGGWF